MYCPKCGAENPDTGLICENCGFSFAKKTQSEKTKEELSFSGEMISGPGMSVLNPKKRVMKLSGGKIAAYCFWGAAILVLVFSIIGAISVFYGGSAIAGIRTYSGNTLEEVFFRRLQPVYNGFGFFLLATGIFCSGVLSFLGLCLHKKDKTKIVIRKEIPESKEEPRAELIQQ